MSHLERVESEAIRADRSKAISANPFDDIPGIGPVHERALMMHFGTSRAVPDATLADLEKAPGISKAIAAASHGHFQSMC